MIVSDDWIKSRVTDASTVPGKHYVSIRQLKPSDIEWLKVWRSQDHPRGANGRFISSGGGGGGSSGGAVIVEPATVMPASHVRSILELCAEKDRHINLEKIDVEGEPNLFNKHTTNLRRAEMPQLPESPAGLKNFLGHMKTNGMKITLSSVDPRQLVAAQNELDSAKVGAIYKSVKSSGGLNKTGGRIYVAKDGSVIDGTHRWAAVSIYANERPGTKIKVARIEGDIHEVIKLANTFKETRHEGFLAGMEIR